jgi:hypothetical protein
VCVYVYVGHAHNTLLFREFWVKVVSSRGITADSLSSLAKHSM